MFVDTLAALIRLDRDLDPALFDGGAVSEDFKTGERSARLFRNPRSDAEYEPRVTYWPQTRSLKVEFSCMKMGGEIGAVLDRTDVWLHKLFGDLPPILSWRVQRIDYIADLLAGKLLPSYLSVLQELRVASWTRVPFANHGVVWKSHSATGRWIKFYDKARETHGSQAGVLRFEVSNFRDAVRYMADRWFACDRTVAELAQAGRAAYVLCYYWHMLGLGNGNYGQRQAELADLRDAFGSRCLAGAAHALHCIREHGPAAYRDLSLISKSTYYRWLNELRAHGFLVQTQKRRTLSPLLLNVDLAFDQALGGNLKKVLTGGAVCVKKNSGQNYWPWLSRKLGLNVKSPLNQYLLERFYAWAGFKSLDSPAGKMPVGDSVAGIQQSAASAAAGIGVVGGLEGRDRSAQDFDRSGSERFFDARGAARPAARTARGSL